MILDKVANAYMLIQDSADTDREHYDLAIEGFKVNIQPVSPEFEAVLGEGSFGKSWIAYTAQSGINETMVIAVSGTTSVSGYKYTVVGVQDWSAPNFIPHYEINLELKGD